MTSAGAIDSKQLISPFKTLKKMPTMDEIDTEWQFVQKLIYSFLGLLFVSITGLYCVRPYVKVHELDYDDFAAIADQVVFSIFGTTMCYALFILVTTRIVAKRKVAMMVSCVHGIATFCNLVALLDVVPKVVYTYCGFPFPVICIIEWVCSVPIIHVMLYHVALVPLNEMQNVLLFQGAVFFFGIAGLFLPLELNILFFIIATIFQTVVMVWMARTFEELASLTSNSQDLLILPIVSLITAFIWGAYPILWMIAVILQWITNLHDVLFMFSCLDVISKCFFTSGITSLSFVAYDMLLSSQLESFDKLLSNFDRPIFKIDDNMRISFTNSHMLTLIGNDPEFSYGKHVRDLTSTLSEDSISTILNHRRSDFSSVKSVTLELITEGSPTPKKVVFDMLCLPTTELIPSKVFIAANDSSDGDIEVKDEKRDQVLMMALQVHKIERDKEFKRSQMKLLQQQHPKGFHPTSRSTRTNKKDK